MRGVGIAPRYDQKRNKEALKDAESLLKYVWKRNIKVKERFFSVDEREGKNVK